MADREPAGAGATDRVRVRRPWAPVDPDNGMTGVLVRLSLSYDVAEPKAPATLVAKFSQPDPEFRAMVHSMGFFEREVRFYSEFAADTPVAVPRCYFAGIDQRRGLVTPAPRRPRTGPSRRGATRILTRGPAGGRLRNRGGARPWWQSHRLTTADWLTMTGFLASAADAAGRRTAVGSRSCRGCRFRSRQPSLRPENSQHNTCREVCAHLSFEAPPRTLIHHDFDGENLFFSTVDEKPSVIVVDWQLHHSRARRYRCRVLDRWPVRP